MRLEDPTVVIVDSFLLIGFIVVGVLIDICLIVKMVIEHLPKKKSANNSPQKA